MVDWFARLDGIGTTVGGKYCDEFGLFESLEDGVARCTRGRGFDGVGEEKLVVTERGVGGKGFDE